MPIRRSIARSASSVLCSCVALALASGCASDLTPGEESGGTSGAPASGGASSAGKGGTTGVSGGTGGSSGGTGGSTGGTPATAGTGNGTGVAGGAPGGAPATAGTGSGSGGTGISAGGAPTAGTGSSVGGAGASAGGAPPAAGAGGGAGLGPTGKYNPDFKEFYGEDCQVGDPKEVNNAKFPDLFANLDGTRMSQKDQWRCRRAELKRIVEKFIHGDKPGKPEKVTGTVSKTSISVKVEHMGKTINFSVPVSIPASVTGPAAAIVGLGGGSLDKAILTEEGVATINYNNGTLADEKSRNGLFTDIYGSTGASAQVGWAWGVSRIIDVLVDEKAAGRNDIIDPTAIGVTGCSRLGKGAFTIGAFDERIALGIPQESGTGGVSAFRVVNTAPVGPNGKPAQSLDSAWTEAQGWFGSVFSTYKGKVNTIPGDTDSLVAMYAPRGLLVLDNSRIGELGSVAQHAASAAGAMVYKALGVEKNIAYHGGRPMDPHNHCTFYPEQAEPLRKAIRAFLTHKAEPDGKIEPQPVATADMSKWVDWEAPTLQ
jgi:glucuronyl esterase-like protein